VAWMFESKGLFIIPGNAMDEEKLMELALEAGADDVIRTDDGKFEVTCSPTAYRDVTKSLTDAGITPEESQITRIAQNTVDVTDIDTARRVVKLMEQLDDHEDVQSVSANFNIPQEVQKAFEEE
jgi:transcriptional/translational regulatory protein YebC/TACO1